MGTSAAFHLAEAGVDVVLARARRARQRLDLTGRGRGARAVLRRAEHPDRPAQPGGVRGFATPARAGRSTSSAAATCSCSAARPTSPRSRRASRCRTATACRRGCSRRRGSRAVPAAARATTSLPRRFRPTTGTPRRRRVVQGYAFAARALGAHVRVGCEVTGDRHRRRPASCACQTSDGPIATDVVICAAGAWSRTCGEMVGEALPVTPLRRQILFTEPMDDLPPSCPSRSTSRRASTSTARVRVC